MRGLLSWSVVALVALSWALPSATGEARDAGGMRSVGRVVTCVPAWKVVDGPVVTEGVLDAVAARSSADVWAVGSTNADGVFAGNKNLSVPLLEHWDGNVWTVVSSPADTGALADVAAISADDVWAVGSADPGTSLIEHWNGQGWTALDAPWRFPLAAVSASSSSNVWAVGNDHTGSAVFRWNGRTWTRSASWRGIFLNDAAALSPRDVWLVGSNSDLPVAIHWNGTRWQRYVIRVPETTSTAEGSEFARIAATSAHNVWATGEVFDWHDRYAFIFHWNGKKWQHVTVRPESSYDSPAAMAVRTNGEIWLTSTDSMYFYPTVSGGGSSGDVRHRQGNTWTLRNLEAGQLLMDLAYDPTGTLWAVGFSGSGDLPEDSATIGFPLHTVPLLEQYGC